jgi:hypothetical protein
MDIKLTMVADDDNPDVGDLYLDGVDIPLVTGKAAVAQHVMVRLKSVKGEWFRNTDAGVPYFEEILGQRNPDIARIQRIFERTITSTPGVASLDQIKLSFDNTTRSLRVHDVEITTTDDEVLTAEDFADLVVLI